MSIFDRLFRRKALYDLHPELLEREPMLRINSEDEMTAPEATGFSRYAVYFQSHMWLQKAVNVLANNIAPLPLKIVRGSGNDIEWLDGHPLQQILNNPNPDMSPSDLWREWVINMMLGGEVGFEAVRNQSQAKVVELWPRQPDSFMVKAESVRYRRVAYYRVDDKNGQPYNLAPDEFIHFKFFNPLQPFRGISPVQAISLSIGIDQLAQAWSRLFFKNAARPDYALLAPEGLTRTERAELENRLTQKHSGMNAHFPIILEQGVTDIKTFSFPPKDTEWINQREMSRDEVAAIMGVPDELMGYGKDTYENFATAERVLWTVTITPLTGLRDGTITRWLRKYNLLKSDESVKTDLRQVPQLQEDRSSKITQANTLFSMGVPVNTISEYLGMGLPEIPGGNTGYLPMNLVPAGESQPEPAPAAGAKNMINPSPNLSPKGSAQGATPATQERGVKAMSGEYGSAEHEALWKSAQSKLDKPVLTIKRIAKKEFQRQQNEVNRKLRESKEFGRGKFKDESGAPPVQSLFDVEAEIQKWIEALDEEVTDATEAVGTAYLRELGLSGSFDVNRPEVKAAIRGILETVATKTNQTTWMDLTQIFEEAEAAGEGVPAIQERLSEYFGDRKSDWQTERIARTTMTGSANMGSLEAIKQVANENNLAFQKEWVSALEPGRTRDEHAAAHGQVVGLDEAFDVGGESLMYPGDPQGDPSNIINCLCVVVYPEKE